MKNPVLVEVSRGNYVESRHRGAIAVSDPDGQLVLALGDVASAVFPRSAVKAFQAVPLIESGAADRFGLTAAEIALACASHSGEPLHTQTAAGMLEKAGRDGTCLECGAHWPLGESAARALAFHGGKPTALHNNCSGKHAGFVCLACDMRVDPKGYVGADHIVQREVKTALEALTGTTLGDEVRAIDGCSIPTYAIPLASLATGFAKLATGARLSSDRAKAVARVRRSVAEHPHMVAGTGRFDTFVMEILRARAFTKTGAEGVFCAALPEQGFGIALKSDDGGTRAAEMMMAEMLARFVDLSDSERAALEPRFNPRLINWRGIEVGRIRSAGPLATVRDRAQ